MKKLFFPGGVLAALLVLVFWTAPLSTTTDTVPAEALDAEIGEVITPSRWKAELRKLRTDPKAPKPDSPDAFAEYHAQIRQRLDGSGPAYRPGYQYEALRAVRAQSFSKNTAWANRQLDWTERGPANVSGRTRGIVIDVRDPAGNTWYAGSVGGGVWKTTDAGRSWRSLTDDLPNLATVTIVQCEAQPEIFYVGTGEGFFNTDAVAGAGIWKSTDGGETWDQLPSTAGRDAFRAVNRLIVDPNNPNLVVAATNQGIYRTTDGGASWAKVEDGGGSRVQHVVYNPDDFNEQYAASNRVGIYKSTDAGATWRQTFDWSTIYNLSSSSRLELAVAPTAPNRIYAAIEAGPNSDLLMSDDSGETWALVEEISGTPPNWLGGQGWYDNTLTVHPFDENVVFAAGQIPVVRIEVSGSANAPKRRTIDLNVPIHPDHHSLLVIPEIEGPGTFRIVNGNDGGVAYTDDEGQTWREVVQFTSGYNTTQFYGADKRPGRDEYIGGMQDNGTWRSPNGVSAQANTPWVPQLGGDGFTVAWHGEDDDLIIGGSQFNNLSRSTDGGRSWEAATRGMTDVGDANGKFITNITKVQNDPDLLFVTGNSGVWRSDDFGASWRLADLDTDNWFTGTNRIPAEISPVNSQIVWSGGAMGSSNSVPVSVYVSQDGGLSFAPTVNVQGVGAAVTNIAAHPEEAETAYVLFATRSNSRDRTIRTPKVLKTTDLGQTWEDLSGTFEPESVVSANGFPNVAVYDLLVMPFDTDLIWLGTEIGLFMSEDGGQTWQRAETGLPAASIWQLAIVDDQVVVATHGRGVWSVTLPELADYTYPEITRAPRLEEAAFSPDGTINLTTAFRSVYDSVAVSINGVPQPASVVGNEIGTGVVSAQLEVAEVEDVEVAVVAYRDGQTFGSFADPLTLFPPVAVQLNYSNAFNDTGNRDFTGDGFSVRRAQAGTPPTNGMLVTGSYQPDRSISAQLRIPIVVAPRRDDAVIRYRDIALVQPGDFGEDDVFPNPEFRDYVVVEASTDGTNWIALADGYDSRFSSDWRQAYNNNLGASADLFVDHELNLHDAFAPGDVVFLRFRLFANDDDGTGQGWFIDDLEVQPNAVSSEDADVPPAFTLEANYPNPFNPSTTIPFTLGQTGDVRVQVYDLQGRLVATVAEGVYPAGAHTVRFDAGTLASGVYLYRLEAGGQRMHRTMTLLK